MAVVNVLPPLDVGVGGHKTLQPNKVNEVQESHIESGVSMSLNHSG